MRFHKKNPTTVSSWALAVVETLEESGYNSKELLNEAGIDGKTLINPDKRIKIKKMTRLWELAVKKTGDSSFGLSVGKNVKPDTFQALGYGLMASSNLYEAFKRAKLFYRSISNALEIELSEKDDLVIIDFIISETKPEPAVEAVDSFLAAVIY